MPEGVSRRELLKKVGLGGVVFLGGSVIGHTVQHQANAAETTEEYNPGASEHSMADGEGGPGLYGHLHSPPTSMGPGDLDHLTIPQPWDGQPAGVVRQLELAVEEKLIEVGDGVLFEAWTYNGSVPAPIIRATEGDTLRIRFENRTGHPHNLHFHGAHRPEQDGWEQVPPGGETTYEIEAGPAGLPPYCARSAEAHTPSRAR